MMMMMMMTQKVKISMAITASMGWEDRAFHQEVVRSLASVAEVLNKFGEAPFCSHLWQEVQGCGEGGRGANPGKEGCMFPPAPLLGGRRGEADYGTEGGGSALQLPGQIYVLIGAPSSLIGCTPSPCLMCGDARLEMGPGAGRVAPPRRSHSSHYLRASSSTL